MSSSLFFAHSDLGKAYQSLKVFFPDKKRCIVGELFGKRKRELPLDELLDHIQRNERVIAAYFVHEKHGENLDLYNHVGGISKKRTVYRRQKTNIETFLSETTEQLGGAFYQLVGRGPLEDVDVREKVETLLEKLLHVYAILTNYEPILEAKKMEWELRDFRNKAKEVRMEKEKKQKKKRIQRKLDARILAAKREYETDYSLDERGGMKEYGIHQLEERCNRAKKRAEQVGITLERVDFVLGYCQRERESSKVLEEVGQPLVYIKKECIEGKKPVAKIYGLPMGGAQQVSEINELENEPERGSIDWLRYKLGAIDEIPDSYAGTHSLLADVRESTVMYILRKAGQTVPPETESERKYDQIIRGILKESYEGGYLKHLSNLGFGENKQIIERAIERNVA